MKRWTILLALVAVGSVQVCSAQVARFRLTETAGLRRFNFPARVSIRADTTQLALFENGKPAPAQFTAKGDGMVEIDFNSSPGPYEFREYRVDRGSSAPFASNVAVVEGNGTLVARTGLDYTAPDNLLGFLRQVSNARTSYLRPGSQGLVLNKNDVEYRVGGKATVTKRGPLVCALRFESLEELGGGQRVKSVVEMEFPRSKSWIEVRWNVEDPESLVTAMMLDLNLLIDGAAVVDFGASNTVYAALKPGQRFAMSASMPTGPESVPWFVHLNNDPYAAGLRSPAEGWAHVMDEHRATAIALDGFGRESNDRMEVASDGRLVIRRDLVRGNERNMHFWLHFVGVPVQLGAATSPQAMMSPLRIQRQ